MFNYEFKTSVKKCFNKNEQLKENLKIELKNKSKS